MLFDEKELTTLLDVPSEEGNVSTDLSTQEPKEEIKKETAQEAEIAKNFRSLREQKERIERERDDAMRRIQEMEMRSQPQQPEEDNETRLGPDDIAEGKHLSKVERKIRKLEEQLKNYEQKSSQDNIETRLKSEYPDINKIVTRENIDALRAAHPEIASTLNSSPDVYNKAVSAYKLIKSLGIHVEDNYQQDRELVQKNSAKPKTLASIAPQQGDSPMSKANAFANGLTDALKAQLYKEMMAARRDM